MLKIPSKIKYVLEIFEKNGFKAYIVGGAVRDLLLNKSPADYDIATNALPEEICEIFEKTVPTGIAHGTVTVITEEITVEATTFRTESGYSDRRRPDRVSFVGDIAEDLARRDFTVNAIALGISGKPICYPGGLYDLESGILRAVGDPEKRFCEDALRILRLFRFASVLNFECEESTLEAALKFADTLKSVSAERIFSELYKCVGGKNPSAVSPLIACGGLSFLKIDSDPDYSAVKKLNGSRLKFFSFLYTSGCDIPFALNTLKVSNELKDYCEAMCTLCSCSLPKSKPEIKKMLCEFGGKSVSDMLSFKKAAFGIDTGDSERFLNEIIANKEPYLISQLALNGNDLKAMGLNGKEIGEALKKLQQAVILSPEANTPSELYTIMENRRN